jgi:phenylalanyl-tRNA synthetase alpha chain
MTTMAVSIENVRQIAAEALTAIEQAKTPEDVEKLRVRFLGKKGEISQLWLELRNVPAEVRPLFGDAANTAKKQVQQALEDRQNRLVELARASRKKVIDVTLPGARRQTGHRHPLMQTMEEIKAILLGMGFRYDDYPEVENEYYNFDALNTPQWHPSRDLHDTFYTEQGHVLRTHTSAFQVRAMKAFGPGPIRAMTSGRCYRRDESDATHSPVFHQLDVIAVDRNISFADLKYTLYHMLKTFLGSDIKLRFRPSYFPFTTPSAEVDVYYGGRWMELLGSGMIRPEVLRNGGIDPEQYRGFAFGMGIDRVTMARFKVNDIRLFYENDSAFLSQF